MTCVYTSSPSIKMVPDVGSDALADFSSSVSRLISADESSQNSTPASSNIVSATRPILSHFDSVLSSGLAATTRLIPAWIKRVAHILQTGFPTTYASQPRASLPAKIKAFCSACIVMFSFSFESSSRLASSSTFDGNPLKPTAINLPSSGFTKAAPTFAFGSLDHSPTSFARSKYLGSHFSWLLVTFTFFNFLAGTSVPPYDDAA